MDDVLNSPQLNARRFWEMVEHPELNDTPRCPGAPVRIEETPWKTCRRAPLVGEHNREICGDELELRAQELALLKPNAVI